MPSEIIPAMKERLIAYKKSPKKMEIEKNPLEEDASGNILLTDRSISNIADKIVQKKRNKPHF